VVVLGVGFGLAAELSSYGSLPVALRIADFAAGCALVVCGGIAAALRRDSRVGALLSVSGFAWFVGNLATPLTYLSRGPLVHVLLAYPTGRLRGRLVAATVVAAYIDGLVLPVAENAVVTVALAALVVTASGRAYAHSAGPSRRPRAVALAGAGAFAIVLAAQTVARLQTAAGGHALLWAYDIVVAAIAVGFLVDLVGGRWAEAVVTGLVVELGAAADVSSLRDQVKRALGDPSAVIAYRIEPTGGFVDDDGHPIPVPVGDPTRVLTPIEQRGKPIAVLVTDAEAVADRGLLSSVAAAAGLAVANARMEAEARARALELKDSRRRLVEAADAERRRLGRELREGAEVRLNRAAATIAGLSEAGGGDDATLKALSSDLAEARVEMETFALGVHPVALTDGGLTQALRLLAERSPIPVEVHGLLSHCPEAVEAALYFVCSEGLANATKHARAARITIDLRDEDREAVVVIADDGIGGADAVRGSGLRGLRDRVQALEGVLELDSPPGGGTRLRAAIPIVATGRG
jgi:signal transduction histidine kinase